MAEEKKKRKKAAAGSDGGEKEHKVPWQEKYASPEEIKAFLSNHIYLRYNRVKYRVEARLPSGDAFCQNSELAQFASDDWQPMSDRLTSSPRGSATWRRCSTPGMCRLSSRFCTT